MSIFVTYLVAKVSAKICSTKPTIRPQFAFKSTLLGLFTLSCLLFSQTATATESVCLPSWITPPATKLETGLRILESDRVSQDHADQFNFDGDVRLVQDSLLLTAKSLSLDNTHEVALAKQAYYQFPGSRAHGQADTLRLEQANDQAFLTHATYTTCPLQQYFWESSPPAYHEDNEKYAWEMSFSGLEVNNNTRRIYGHHVVLTFQSAPIFYTPYINFSLDERASGLLSPSFGQYKSLGSPHADDFYLQPMYINLAPNLDDTLTLSYFERRGFAIDNELRYLSPIHNTTLAVTGLQDEKTATEGLSYFQGNTPIYGKKVEDRGRFKLASTQSWNKHITSHLNWVGVTDPFIFKDVPLIDRSLNTATQVARSADIQYQDAELTAKLSFIDYLTLTHAPNTAYGKRPELAVDYVKEISTSRDFGSLTLLPSALVTEFAIPHDEHTKPLATRTVVEPKVSYTLNRPYADFTTTLTSTHLNYQMVSENNPTDENTHTASIPQLLIKGGLIFERDFVVANRGFIQTLEPTVQYVYTDYVDQSDQPLFDTGNRSLAFSNLFESNRFSGYDRIGDTHHVVLALTSKILTQEGAPIIDASIGQQLFFADRQVQLTGNVPATNKVSDYYVNINLTREHVNFSSTATIDHETETLSIANNRLKIALNDTTKLLVSNTISNYELENEQIDFKVGYMWNMNANWTVGGYINYDRTQDKTLERFHAIRYDSCCWAFDLSMRDNYIDTSPDNEDDKTGFESYTYFAQFTLKGLSAFGQPFTDILDKELNF